MRPATAVMPDDRYWDHLSVGQMRTPGSTSGFDAQKMFDLSDSALQLTRRRSVRVFRGRHQAFTLFNLLIIWPFNRQMIFRGEDDVVDD